MTDEETAPAGAQPSDAARTLVADDSASRQGVWHDAEPEVADDAAKSEVTGDNKQLDTAVTDTAVTDTEPLTSETESVTRTQLNGYLTRTCRKATRTRPRSKSATSAKDKRQPTLLES